MLDDAEKVLAGLVEACARGDLEASSVELAALAGALEAVRGIKADIVFDVDRRARMNWRLS